MFSPKPKDGGGSSSDDEFWGVSASGVPAARTPSPIYGASSAPQQAGTYYGNPGAGAPPQQQQQQQQQQAGAPPAWHGGYAFPSVPAYPGQPAYYGTAAPAGPAQSPQQQQQQQQMPSAYAPPSSGFPYYPYGVQPSAPPASGTMTWSTSAPDLLSAGGGGGQVLPSAPQGPLKHAASTGSLHRQPSHPHMLGAHHYQQAQQQQQTQQQTQQQQQFVFGHGATTSAPATPQMTTDTPRPHTMVIPATVAQNKSFVPPRPPSLILPFGAHLASAASGASTASATSEASGATTSLSAPGEASAAGPSPRRSILAAIGLGKGRRNTEMAARHRKGTAASATNTPTATAAAAGEKSKAELHRSSSTIVGHEPHHGRHGHHGHSTTSEPETPPQQPQTAPVPSTTATAAKKPHPLRNPLLGGGHRNSLQEMLKDKEVEEERRKRRELREKKKEEVKKHNEEIKKKERQEQAQRPTEELSSDNQQAVEDAQSRRQLAEERARLEEERQRMEKEVEERIKREVENRLKQQEQQLLQQVELQMRQQEEERRRKLEEELQKQREEIEAREKLRLAQLEEERKKQEEESRIRQEKEERKREAEQLLEEERRKGEQKIAEQKTSLQQSFNAELWKKEIEAKLRREMEEEEQRRRQAESAAAGGEKHVWELSSKDIILGRTLGKGAFGVVYAGKLHGKEVAVKKLLAAEIDQEALSAFKHEVDIMNKLRHPNILLFMGACVEGDQLMIVTELMPRGSVEDIIHKSKTTLSFKQRMKIGKDCALGMNWLHRLKPPFLHLDLKLGNLLVDQNWNVKVADFGLSKVYNPEAAGDGEMVGSPFYMAPELLLQKDFDEKVDVYSFGVVLWELYTMEEPYKGLFDSLDELIEAVALDEERPEVPEDCPPLLKKLITSCWQADPTLRPSFGEILKENTLDIVIIQSAVKDTIGQAFWTQHFVEHDVVGWREWLDAFRKYFGVPTSKVKDDAPVIQALKLLLCDAAGDESVTVEAWGNALQWFGPLDTQATAFLAALSSVTSQGWFFGDISRIEAESRLRAANKGAFLVRFSASQPGSFTLSFLYSAQTGPKHVRINRNDRGELVYADVTYASLDQFIRAQSRSLNLRLYCPGSAYAKLWEGRRRAGDGSPAGGGDDNDDDDAKADDAYAFFDPAQLN